MVGERVYYVATHYVLECVQAASDVYVIFELYTSDRLHKCFVDIIVVHAQIASIQ